ncbi:hypothetical protein EAF00_007489 [Botryotinia globosa]|nr:hypothetical protein EAF00_007489 [Botryotinia globosa]
MTPLTRVADFSSEFKTPENYQMYCSRDLKKQGQILEDVLPSDQGPCDRKTTLAGDDRIFIDLTRIFEHDSELPGEKPLEGSISIVRGAQGYHRSPLADITHHIVPINLVVLPTYEYLIASFPPVSTFRIFEDLCEAQLWETRGKDLGTTLDLSSSADKSTSIDAIDLSHDPEDETSKKSSVLSKSIQSSPSGSFPDRSFASHKITSSCNARSASAVVHLADKPDQDSPGNKLECRERKRIIVSSTRRPPHVKKSMQIWLESTNRLLDPFREDVECWFHPAPPPPASLLSVRGVLAAIYRKLSAGKITMKDGFVNKKWHPSHLCGNWTCLNANHTTVEPGNVNISRNSCFSHRGGCSHEPKCMKEKKANLSAKGLPIYHNDEIMQDADARPSSGEVQGWGVQSYDVGHNSSEHEMLLVN